MEENQRVYDRDVDAYKNYELFPAEQRLLGMYKGRWHKIKMLDLGVGTGRTSYTFAPIAGSYVGLDYAPRMIYQCRKLFPNEPPAGARFVVGDARDLSSFPTGHFELVLFSYNGIDYVDLKDRESILREVKRVLLPDRGRFLFSAHSLNVFPFRHPIPKVEWRRPFRSALNRTRALRFSRKLASSNRGIDPAAAKARGWAFLNDGAHHFSLRALYVTPEFQLCQLREQGFRVEALYDTAGDEIDPLRPGNDYCLHYLCSAPTR
jgi:ubiquinone/menaquinone biosynthesis C-methylase UbiE